MQCTYLGPGGGGEGQRLSKLALSSVPGGVL
jgi:hypothetical protein